MALSKVSETSNVEVESIITPEDFEDVQMGIKGDAMRLIIDRLTDLYPRPIVASVREVVSNAVDATMILDPADRRPVEVNTPSSLNATFSVTDHGVGMSLDDVKTIYSQYGGSTKRERFDQIGAYGLGAKAPLAYCTEFSVSTTKDGVTTNFIAARKPEGNVISITSSAQTGRSSGTVVSIPARNSDAHEFRSALESYREFESDVPISIDGEVTASSDAYYLFDEFVLDAESNTTGRVWIKRDVASVLETFVNTWNRRWQRPQPVFVLSGWLYNRSHYGSSSRMVVELKPGVVDFSSSRDEIIKNGRFDSLCTRISDQYSTPDLENIEKFLAVFRQFTPPEAIEALRSMPVTVGDDPDTVVFTVTPSPSAPASKVVVSRKSFTLACGFNVFDEMERDNNTEVFCGVDFSSRAPTAVNFSRPSGGNTLFKTVVPNTYYVKDALEKFEEYTQEDDLPTVKEFTFTPRGRVAGIAFVEHGDLDFMKPFIRGRKIMAEELYPDYRFIILKDTIPDDEIETAKVLLGIPVVRISKEDVITEVEAIRKARRAAKSKAPKSEGYVKASIYSDGFLSYDSISNHYQQRRPVWYSKLISEMIAEDAILLVVDDRSGNLNAASILNGVDNDSGISVLSKKIYLIRYQGLRVDHYKMLQDYDKAFTGGIPTLSKASQKFAADRHYSHSVMKNQAKSLDPADLIAAIARTHSINFSSTFAQELMTKTDIPGLADTVKLFQTRPANYNHGSLASGILPFLDESLGKEKASAVRAIVTTFNEIRLSRSDCHSLVLTSIVTSANPNLNRVYLDQAVEDFCGMITKNATADNDAVS